MYLDIQSKHHKLAVMSDEERSKHFLAQQILARNANEDYDDWWEKQFTPDEGG